MVDHVPNCFRDESPHSAANLDERHQSPRGRVPKFSTGKLSTLIDQGNDREKQRLRRLDCKHANSWITSIPSATDSRDTIMDPKSIPQQLHALLAFLSTIILSRVLFASNLWMY